MIVSVTEGKDKPLKFPLMFRFVGLILVNRIDLLPRLEFSRERFSKMLDMTHPIVPRILSSSKTGKGMGDWFEQLTSRPGHC